MHVFPQLRKLEEKYAGELAVVGVHSAKFNAEKATDGVRRAILRYEIEHPVINDADFMVWQQYACRAWPTLMFISPSGKVIGKHEGEFPIEALDNVLSEMIGEFDEHGRNGPQAARLQTGERTGMGASPLLPRQGPGIRSWTVHLRLQSQPHSLDEPSKAKSAPSSEAVNAA